MMLASHQNLNDFARLDYWDSYWIVRGLLKSELYDIANDTLQNFMDEIEHFGFIPNGGRIYCRFPLQSLPSRYKF